MSSAATERFHAHLEVCERCFHNPMMMCALGGLLLQAAAEEAQANLPRLP